jgi:ribosomal protein L11 methyltransferase
MRHAGLLETVSVTVPESAVPAYEAALGLACGTVGFFVADEDAKTWRVEGVKPVGEKDDVLASGVAVAALATGADADVLHEPTAADGWLARVYQDFPEQFIGKRFAVRGTHLGAAPVAGRVTLTIDAGLAFGSGEHGSTRGCLRALEIIAHRRPQRILDLGCGSGILAMAAAALLGRRVLAVDNDPWSVRTTRRNAAQNRLGNRIIARLGHGWSARAARAHAPYDLVFANILARPLCLMARDLSAHLAPGGTAILSGLLNAQMRAVLASHRRCGLRLDRVLREGAWTILIIRKHVLF